MESIAIRTEHIKLCQALKLAGAVDTGSDANNLIAEGQALVNGEVELRRGKKLYPGDKFAIVGGPPFLVESC